MKQLEALADIEVASNLLKTRSVVGMNPIDASYAKLGAE